MAPEFRLILVYYTKEKFAELAVTAATKTSLAKFLMGRMMIEEQAMRRSDFQFTPVPTYLPQNRKCGKLICRKG